MKEVPEHLKAAFAQYYNVEVNSPEFDAKLKELNEMSEEELREFHRDVYESHGESAETANEVDMLMRVLAETLNQTENKQPHEALAVSDKALVTLVGVLNTMCEEGRTGKIKEPKEFIYGFLMGAAFGKELTERRHA